MKNLTTALLLSFFVLVACKKDKPVPERPTPANYVGNLNITTLTQLENAITLGSRVSEIVGNVYLLVGNQSTYTAAQVSEVTKLFGTIDGNLIIDTSSSLDLSGLTSVSGEYSLRGSEVNHQSLNSVGVLRLNYTGNYNMPNLSSANHVVLYDLININAKKATTKIITSADFSGLSQNVSFRTVPGAEGEIRLKNAQRLCLGSGVKVVSVDTPDALEIKLNYSSSLESSLTINAPNCLKINLGASGIRGDLLIEAPGADIQAPNLTIVEGNINRSLEGINPNGIVNFPNLTTVQGLININANQITQNTGQPHNSGGDHDSGGDHNSGGAKEN